MKRQKLRKVFILVSFLLFPVTIYYFSPALIVQGAAEGIVVGSFIVFLLMFMASLFFGRAFCGWLCPAAGLQEACFIANDKRTAGGKYDFIKYLIWAPWISLIVFFFIKAGLRGIDPFYETNRGISVYDATGVIVLCTVLALVVVPSLLLGKRSFCHYMCWMAPFMVLGVRLQRIFRWPALHLGVKKEKCTGCRKCTVGCPMSLNVHEMVARASMNNLECSLCGNCADTCPNKVIAYRFRKTA